MIPGLVGLILFSALFLVYLAYFDLALKKVTGILLNGLMLGVAGYQAAVRLGLGEIAEE